jgi:hypothetical protein
VSVLVIDCTTTGAPPPTRTPPTSTPTERRRGIAAAGLLEEVIAVRRSIRVRSSPVRDANVKQGIQALPFA